MLCLYLALYINKYSVRKIFIFFAYWNKLFLWWTLFGAMHLITASFRLFLRKFILNSTTFPITWHWGSWAVGEIGIFLTGKDKADPFLSDSTLLSKLSFLVDITSLKNELNLKLQEKDDLISDLYRIFKGFWRKLLFEAQLEGGNFSHFSASKFNTGITEVVNLKYLKKIICDQNKHFLERFE